MGAATGVGSEYAEGTANEIRREQHSSLGEVQSRRSVLFVVYRCRKVPQKSAFGGTLKAKTQREDQLASVLEQCWKLPDSSRQGRGRTKPREEM